MECDKKQILKAKETVYRLLKFRLRSEKEIRDKLLSKDFDSTSIDKTVHYFKEIDLIDDRTFSKGWILSRLAKPYGVNRIKLELKNKGIDKEIIEQEIAAATDNFDEVETACRLANKRISKYKNIEKLKKKQRIYGYLARRGFSPYAINKAIQQL